MQWYGLLVLYDKLNQSIMVCISSILECRMWILYHIWYQLLSCSPGGIKMSRSRVHDTGVSQSQYRAKTGCKTLPNQQLYIQIMCARLCCHWLLPPSSTYCNHTEDKLQSQVFMLFHWSWTSQIFYVFVYFCTVNGAIKLWKLSYYVVLSVTFDSMPISIAPVPDPVLRTVWNGTSPTKPPKHENLPPGSAKTWRKRPLAEIEPTPSRNRLAK